MRLDEAIDMIESCETIDALKHGFQRVVEHYGFASYGFVDIGNPTLDSPFWMATSDKNFIEDYRSNGFVHTDPMIPIVRRTNIPFAWSDVPLPHRGGKRKSGALRIMDAARDYGMTDGLVIPFHFVDRLGRMNSASCAFHWKQRGLDFLRLPKEHRSELHILLIYWAQRVMELAARDLGRRRRLDLDDKDAEPVNLTDRERSILEWAGRGKTMAETAAILSISGETVETHVRNAMRKLNSVNKTQAVACAIKLGIIDI